jgi:hypothetical protein
MRIMLVVYDILSRNDSFGTSVNDQFLRPIPELEPDFLVKEMTDIF